MARALQWSAACIRSTSGGRRSWFWRRACGAGAARRRSDRPAASRRNAAAESAALRAKGLELGYNLDHDDALAAFRAGDRRRPHGPGSAPARRGHDVDPAAVPAGGRHGGRLPRTGAIGSRQDNLRRLKWPPRFQAHIDRALELCERRLRSNPADADAHFQVGAAHGFLTTYKATVEGRVVGGFRTARRAYTRARARHGARPQPQGRGPHRRHVPLRGLDAVGAAAAAGAGSPGSAEAGERGLRLVEEAAAYPSDVQTNAMFTLIVIYNREGRYDDALRVIGELQRRYPRNRLLWLEAASTALRAVAAGRRAARASRTGCQVRGGSAPSRLRRSGALALLPRRRARRRCGRPTPRRRAARRADAAKRPSGCAAARTRSSASSPTWRAIARGRMTDTGSRRASAAPITTQPCADETTGVDEGTGPVIDRDARACQTCHGHRIPRESQTLDRFCSAARRRGDVRPRGLAVGLDVRRDGHARHAPVVLRRPTCARSSTAGRRTIPRPEAERRRALFDFVYQTYESSAWIPQSLFDSNLVTQAVVGDVDTIVGDKVGPGALARQRGRSGVRHGAGSARRPAAQVDGQLPVVPHGRHRRRHVLRGGHEGVRRQMARRLAQAADERAVAAPAAGRHRPTARWPPTRTGS